jgi:hypothetical protein
MIANLPVVGSRALAERRHRDTLTVMKRRLAWLAAGISGFYLVVLGPVPDPLPFLDEATALLIFVKSLAFLGYDVKRWIPFLSRGKTQPPPPPRGARDATIDV